MKALAEIQVLEYLFPSEKSEDSRFYHILFTAAGLIIILSLLCSRSAASDDFV